MPADLARGVPVVTAEVDGSAALFVLDTGASRSVLTEAAVQRLSLPLDEWASMTMRGIGGAVRRRVANLRSLTLGGAPLRRKSAAGNMSIAVVPGLPLPVQTPVAGLIGGDFLSAYDLEWDGSRLRLFTAAECSGRFAPWPGRYDALTAEPAVAGWMVVALTIDGHRLRALLDTGAQRSLLTPRGAAALGINAAAQGDARLAGVGAAEVSASPVIVRRMVVGSETTDPAGLLLAQGFVIPGIDVVLGADWFAGRRVWLSYATGQVFVSGPAAR